MKSIIIAATISGALASLNCTATAEVKTYCCPDTKSELVKTGPAGALIMMGCAADNTNNSESTDEKIRNWYWNYNGLYTAYSTQFKDCYLNTIPFNDLKVLPDCKDDTYVLDLTRGKSGPLDKCNPNCVSQNKFPANTYFGDRQKETNMASDFPRPNPSPGWPWARRGRRF
ncbi:hypothetical protein JMJ77_0006874 [Colletotrichum scovillei]|uniref:Secreted protein n=1 Tax=Colletotrichum scovillei TaxID=1209932 RepID=A0A9P7RJX6_9PEZI|nr:hypothetical protein JMJ77_0006874 [Colletotrichum scovillei]KAG7078120.1 hypothetical protein JMJ76_0015355 [Colletotrichum scovillei]KAG7085235.1 hypothetical protein JMJ78_0010660 [Colletotrichum scovillei]